jgi:hypothetical protein
LLAIEILWKISGSLLQAFYLPFPEHLPMITLKMLESARSHNIHWCIAALSALALTNTKIQM